MAGGAGRDAGIARGWSDDEWYPHISSSRYARRRAVPFEGFLASVVVASAAAVVATAAAEAVAAGLLLGHGCSGG